jgi:hypothetical protein
VSAVLIKPLPALFNRQPLIVKPNTPYAHTAVLVKDAVNSDELAHFVLLSKSSTDCAELVLSVSKYYAN